MKLRSNSHINLSQNDGNDLVKLISFVKLLQQIGNKMFIGAVYTSDRAGIYSKRIDFHLDKLVSMGAVGDTSKIIFGNLAIHFDSTSSHFYHSKQNSAEFFFGGYMSEKHSWVGDLHTSENNGTWGEWIAFKITSSAGSNGTKNLKVFNGPSGSWPIYYGQQNGNIAISNDPLFVAISIGSNTLNLKGSIELLTYSHTLGVETTIQNVKKLLYEQELFLDIDTNPKLSTRRRKYVYGYRDITTNPNVIFNKLNSGVAKNLSISEKLSKSTLQISGGLDSRLTLAVLANNFNERPISKTLNISSDAEVIIAKDVASLLGFPHKIIELEKNKHSLNYLYQGWILTGGQVAPHAAAGNIIFYELDSYRGPEKVVIGAWPGDCLIGSYVVNNPLMFSKIATGLAISRWVANRPYSLEDLGIKYNNHEIMENTLKIIDEELIGRINKTSGFNAAQKISFWAMFDRQPAFSYVSPSNLIANVIQITPLLADGYIKELLKLNSRDLMNKNFYRKFIFDNFKNVADIPYALTNNVINREYSNVHLIPRNYNELFLFLPVKLIKKSKYIAKVIKNYLQKNKILQVTSSLEVNFWLNQLSLNADFNAIEIDGITLINEGSNLHSKSIFFALLETKKHIEEASLID